MLISHNKKFIFIHNYKVAGSSIRAALRDYNFYSWRESSHLNKLKLITGKYPAIYSRDFDGHIKASELIQKINSKIFNSYYKFGFVRNPWDWQVSLYSFMLKTKDHPQHGLVSKFKNFDEYIDWRIHEDLHLQKDFFYDGGICLVDFIGKHETLQNDFKKVCSKCNIETDLPHLNASRKKKDHYVKYYSPNSIELISQAFKEDIELFDYRIPTLTNL